MSIKEKIQSTDDAWESEQLGADENHIKTVDPALAEAIDESIGLQMISIRLDRSLIESFKLLSAFHGLGYQPLMRDALNRFADAELKAIVSGMVESQRKEQSDKRRPKVPKALKEAA